jgi:hypothetical protein
LRLCCSYRNEHICAAENQFTLASRIAGALSELRFTDDAQTERFVKLDNRFVLSIDIVIRTSSLQPRARGETRSPVFHPQRANYWYSLFCGDMYGLQPVSFLCAQSDSHAGNRARRRAMRESVSVTDIPQPVDPIKSQLMSQRVRNSIAAVEADKAPDHERPKNSPNPRFPSALR